MVAEALEASEHQVESGLLAEAFGTLDRLGWSVLDLGPATPSTVEFYTDYRCRVGFADALDTLASLGGQEPLDPQTARHAVEQAVPLDSQRPWRLVLLWDLLDYLPGAILEQLAAHLKQALVPGALVHGFVTDGPQTVPGRPAVYEILDRDALQRSVDQATGRRSPPRYSAWHLQHHMPGFQQETSRQRRDASQEHLLRLEP